MAHDDICVNHTMWLNGRDLPSSGWFRKFLECGEMSSWLNNKSSFKDSLLRQIYCLTFLFNSFMYLCIFLGQHRKVGVAWSMVQFWAQDIVCVAFHMGCISIPRSQRRDLCPWEVHSWQVTLQERNLQGVWDVLHTYYYTVSLIRLNCTKVFWISWITFIH